MRIVAALVVFGVVSVLLFVVVRSLADSPPLFGLLALLITVPAVSYIAVSLLRKL